MLNKMIEQAFYSHLKKNYNIKKYENYFSPQERMELYMYANSNGYKVEFDNKKITIERYGKVVAVAEYVFSNLISKYNNRLIPKSYNITRI